ncbi:MAG: hypothetical protein CM1200mP41_19180 [Gammaproteobacteria bacterium]|nr:MAG: hypothetical protein CM1200mP41_19180 [Gammaproteobacteria bacterium]
MGQPGGVLTRAGHTEAGIDLARLSGLVPASVICEILNPDGTMARLPDLMTFAATHDLRIGTIADLIRYRLESNRLSGESQNIRSPRAMVILEGLFMKTANFARHTSRLSGA